MAYAEEICVPMHQMPLDSAGISFSLPFPCLDITLTDLSVAPWDLAFLTKLSYKFQHVCLLADLS